MVNNSRIKDFIIKLLVPEEVIDAGGKTNTIDLMVVCKINVEPCP
jgi:hypothetical protein